MENQVAESALEKVRRDLDMLLPKNTNNAVITVNAGGVGVWIATTACLIMLAVNVVLVAIVMDQSRKVDDLGDYLNAIYMQAPYLKPAGERNDSP